MADYADDLVRSGAISPKQAGKHKLPMKKKKAPPKPAAFTNDGDGDEAPAAAPAFTKKPAKGAPAC